MTTYDVRVTDKRPKAIVRHLLTTNIGPRNPQGRDAILASWWDQCSDQLFDQFMREQDWTLGEILSYMEWQTVYISGEIDEQAYAAEWATVKQIFDHLLTPAQIAQVTSAHHQPASDDIAAIEL